MACLASIMSPACLLIVQALTFTAAVKLRQSAIISHLRDSSDPDVIPLPDSNDSPLEVNINLSLTKILDVDVERNEIDVLVFQETTWNNPALAWEVGRDGFSATTVALPSQYLWLPDIAVYNAVGSREIVSPDVAVVASNGSVYYIPNLRVRVYCDLQGIDSHSGSTCSLKLGSWTQSTKTVTLSNNGNGIYTGAYVAIPNYDLLATFATKHSQEYPCCPGERFEDIEFKFILRKLHHPVPVSEDENGSEK
ncbi:hypothetical protein BsWGS_22694 [Bradybaena similaris]